MSLENSVHLCRRGQRGTRINLNQPRLHIVLNQDIEAVDLKTVPVIDDLRLHGLQRNENYVVDVAKQLFTSVVASRLLNVESQVFDGPLATVLLVVAITEFLDGNIRQVHHHIVQLRHITRVLLSAKASKTTSMQVDFQRSIARDQHIHPQVKLLIADKEGFVYVSADDVVLCEVRLLELGDLRLRPLLQLVQLVD